MNRLNLLMLILSLVLAPMAGATMPFGNSVSGVALLENARSVKVIPVANTMPASMAGEMRVDCSQATANGCEMMASLADCSGCETSEPAHGCCQLTFVALLSTPDQDGSPDAAVPHGTALCAMHVAPCYPIFHPPQ